MEDGIRVRKTTLLLFAGLAIAMVVGAYVVFGTGTEKGRNGTATGGSDAGGVGNANGNVLAPALAPSGDGGAPQVQEVYLRALGNGGYDKGEITVRKGIPVRLHFTADSNAGCGRLVVIYGLNVKAVSQNGEEDVVEFTPQEEGSYEYSCGMRMWGPGRLVVTG